MYLDALADAIIEKHKFGELHILRTVAFVGYWNIPAFTVS